MSLRMAAPMMSIGGHSCCLNFVAPMGPADGPVKSAILGGNFRNGPAFVQSCIEDFVIEE